MSIKSVYQNNFGTSSNMFVPKIKVKKRDRNIKSSTMRPSMNEIK